MRRALPVLLTTTLALGAVAFAPETTETTETTEDLTDHPCYDPATEQLAYPEEQVWFHEGDSKLGNLSAAPWDTTPPEASVLGAAGAVAVSSSAAVLAENTPTATFAGTFEGCIDTVLFDLYSLDPTNRTGTSLTLQPAEHNLSLTVTIDGTKVFSGGPLATSTEFANEGLGPNLNRFALDLGDLLELFSEFGSFTLDGTHEIEVAVAAWYVNTGHAIYLWGATEVPSGLTFNGEVTEDYAALN